MSGPYIRAATLQKHTRHRPTQLAHTDAAVRRLHRPLFGLRHESFCYFAIRMPKEAAQLDNGVEDLSLFWPLSQTFPGALLELVA